MKLCYVDLEQAESRVVGAIVYRLFGEVNYLAATESGDLHTLNCSMVWPNYDWPKEFTLDNAIKFGKFPDDMLFAAKQIAKKQFYRDKSMRDTAKPLDHGLNYYGQPPQMSKHTHIDVKIIQRFMRVKFDAFPGIPRWHRWVAEQLQTTRTITTMLGRRRYFFGRPGDDATLRKAIAFEPQSVATGDYMNRRIYNLWKANLPIHIFGQVHDAVEFAYDEQDEHWIIDYACRLLETELSITSPEGLSRSFSIPTEALVGWNLAYPEHRLPDGTKVFDNPDGLKVWSGEDERQRTRHIKTKIIDFALPHQLG